MLAMRRGRTPALHDDNDNGTINGDGDASYLDTATNGDGDGDSIAPFPSQPRVSTTADNASEFSLLSSTSTAARRRPSLQSTVTTLVADVREARSPRAALARFGFTRSARRSVGSGGGGGEPGPSAMSSPSPDEHAGLDVDGVSAAEAAVRKSLQTLSLAAPAPAAASAASPSSASASGSASGSGLPLLTLVLAGASFRDCTVLDGAARLYTLDTDRRAQRTRLVRDDSLAVGSGSGLGLGLESSGSGSGASAGVAGKGKGKGGGPEAQTHIGAVSWAGPRARAQRTLGAKVGATVQMAHGRQYTVDEFLRQGKFSSSRMFSIPHYPHTFKWKFSGGVYKLIAIKSKTTIATLEPAQLPLSPRIRIHTTLADAPPGPERMHKAVPVVLLDYILMTALVLTAERGTWLFGENQTAATAAASASRTAMRGGAQFIQRWRTDVNEDEDGNEVGRDEPSSSSGLERREGSAARPAGASADAQLRSQAPSQTDVNELDAPMHTLPRSESQPTLPLVAPTPSTPGRVPLFLDIRPPSPSLTMPSISAFADESPLPPLPPQSAAPSTDGFATPAPTHTGSGSEPASALASAHPLSSSSLPYASSRAHSYASSPAEGDEERSASDAVSVARTDSYAYGVNTAPWARASAPARSRSRVYAYAASEAGGEYAYDYGYGYEYDYDYGVVGHEGRRHTRTRSVSDGQRPELGALHRAQSVSRAGGGVPQASASAPVQQRSFTLGAEPGVPHQQHHQQQQQQQRRSRRPLPRIPTEIPPVPSLPRELVRQSSAFPAPAPPQVQVQTQLPPQAQAQANEMPASPTTSTIASYYFDHSLTGASVADLHAHVHAPALPLPPPPPHAQAQSPPLHHSASASGFSGHPGREPGSDASSEYIQHQHPHTHPHQHQYQHQQFQHDPPTDASSFYAPPDAQAQALAFANAAADVEERYHSLLKSVHRRSLHKRGAVVSPSAHSSAHGPPGQLAAASITRPGSAAPGAPHSGGGVRALPAPPAPLHFHSTSGVDAGAGPAAHPHAHAHTHVGTLRDRALVASPTSTFAPSEIGEGMMASRSRMSLAGAGVGRAMSYYPPPEDEDDDDDALAGLAPPPAYNELFSAQ